MAKKKNKRKGGRVWNQMIEANRKNQRLNEEKELERLRKMFGL